MPASIPIALPTWLAILLGLFALSATVFLLISPWSPKPKDDTPWTTRALNAYWITLTPIWAVLFAITLYDIWNALLPSFTTPSDTNDLRWKALTLLGLASAPLALIRVYTTERQTRTAEQGHMTDRISKAVEQLGAEKTVKITGKDKDGNDKTVEASKPNIEVRIGGLLSLERIAQDSVKYDRGRDHVRVMEILCTYIQENAPASSAVKNPFADNIDDDGDCGINHIAKLWSWAASLPPPRGDIAIALRIIGRRSPAQHLAEAAWPNAPSAQTTWPFATPCPRFPKKPEGSTWDQKDIDTFKTNLEAWKETLGNYPGYRPDLRQTNLQGADLSGLNLAGVRLDKARLEGANLREAKIQGAKLESTKIQVAHLDRAQMQGTDLDLANMQGAILNGAQMQGAKFGQTMMQRAQLSEVQMQGAWLSGAKMQGAFLYPAQMQGAFLGAAQMQGAILCEACFDVETTIIRTDFTDAALRNTDCSMLTLSPKQINSMFGDASVTLPGGITPDHPDWPPRWPRHELGWDDFETELEKWRDDPDGYKPPDANALKSG